MTSKEEDDVWTRAIIEETLGNVEGRERRRYFPRPGGASILYLPTKETEIRARGWTRGREYFEARPHFCLRIRYALFPLLFPLL